MYLLTYRARTPCQEDNWGMEFVKDPIEWLASVQEFKEDYFIVSVVPATIKQAAKYDGVFKGM